MLHYLVNKQWLYINDLIYIWPSSRSLEIKIMDFFCKITVFLSFSWIYTHFLLIKYTDVKIHNKKIIYRAVTVVLRNGNFLSFFTLLWQWKSFFYSVIRKKTNERTAASLEEDSSQRGRICTWMDFGASRRYWKVFKCPKQ